MENKIKEFIGIKAYYDKEAQYIFGVNLQEQFQLLIDLRDWGAIQ